MPEPIPLQVLPYRGHRIEILDDGPGWAVRIYADHPSRAAPIELQVAAPHASEKLLSAARQAVDAAMLSRMAIPGNAAPSWADDRR